MRKKITDKLDKQLKGVAEEQNQKFRKEFNIELQETQRNSGVTRQDFEVGRRDIEANEQVEHGNWDATGGGRGRTTRGGGENTGTSAKRVKPSKFDGSASSAGFHRQFEAASDHKWTSCEKAVYLLLTSYSAPSGATYEGIVGL